MSKTNLDNIASEKQKRIVKYIETHCEIEFQGTTKEDVFEFINKWWGRAKQMAEMDAIVKNYSVQTYKMHCDASTDWKWEEDDYLPRDGIAHERFIGSIIRGEDPLLTLARFELEAALEKSNTD